MAILSLAGALELWHMFVLVAVYGAGTAFFGPAFDAIVPDLMPDRAAGAGQLARPARAADRLPAGRPGAGRLDGGRPGVGTAFALDSATSRLGDGGALDAPLAGRGSPRRAR